MIRRQIAEFQTKSTTRSYSDYSISVEVPQIPVSFSLFNFRMNDWMIHERPGQMAKSRKLKFWREHRLEMGGATLHPLEQ